MVLQQHPSPVFAGALSAIFQAHRAFEFVGFVVKNHVSPQIRVFENFEADLTSFRLTFQVDSLEMLLNV
jgi:hypothetical protein